MRGYNFRIGETNMWEKIVSLLLNFLSFITSRCDKRSTPSDYRKEFDQLRKEISAALTFYADCYSDPVDLAKSPYMLPQKHKEGSDKLRELASKLRAFAETLPQKTKDIPASAQQIQDAADCLIGLSNSFTTPYNCGVTSEQLRNTRDFVQSVKEKLNLTTNGEQKWS